MQIVIVEDVEGIRKELKRLLENAFYQVTVIESFTDVAGQIRVLCPAADLVLLDLNLPGESGFDVCRKLREYSDIPIIFLTSRTDSMDELTGILNGADDYITKPFNPPILLARIGVVLKRTTSKNAVKSTNDTIHLEYKGVTLNLAGAYVETCREEDGSYQK